MKTTETILAHFIHDFELEVPGVGVCFQAIIEFTTASISKNFNSEVHIITMTHKKESLVYLLDKDLTGFGIPDTFTFDAASFFYEKDHSLTIIDYDLLRGKYTLKIIPARTELRLAEIKH